MNRSISSVSGLVERGFVAPLDAPDLQKVGERYAIAITPDMLNLMDAADLADPIALQFVPSFAELDASPFEHEDPIGDHAHSPVEGLVHRYPDRVLLKAVHVCPVYCRFCFRREMVGPAGDGLLSAEKLAAAYDYIREHPEIWEVIITGGDPLALSPRRLQALLQPLQSIAHVRIVRFHTRVPAVDPRRVDAAMVEALLSGGKTTILALHANHPRELTVDARAACVRLQASGIGMVSQTVLLKGVNNDIGTLSALMRSFVEMQIKPYYLHHPDLAPGTAHFRIPVAEGQALVGALRGRLSGLCQPTYVLDIPGGFGKVDLMSNAVTEMSAGEYEIRDYQGRVHSYVDRV